MAHMNIRVKFEFESQSYLVSGAAVGDFGSCVVESDVDTLLKSMDCTQIRLLFAGDPPPRKQF